MSSQHEALEAADTLSLGPWARLSSDSFVDLLAIGEFSTHDEMIWIDSDPREIGVPAMETLSH
jgi:hypothetical protein